jgi:hypothetical protein
MSPQRSCEIAVSSGVSTLYIIPEAPKRFERAGYLDSFLLNLAYDEGAEHKDRRL